MILLFLIRVDWIFIASLSDGSSAARASPQYSYPRFESRRVGARHPRPKQLGFTGRCVPDTAGGPSVNPGIHRGNLSQCEIGSRDTGDPF